MPVITYIKYDVSRNPAFESSVKTNSNSCRRQTAQYKPTAPLCPIQINLVINLFFVLLFQFNVLSFSLPLVLWTLDREFKTSR